MCEPPPRLSTTTHGTPSVSATSIKLLILRKDRRTLVFRAHCICPPHFRQTRFINMALIKLLNYMQIYSAPDFYEMWFMGQLYLPWKLINWEPPLRIYLFISLSWQRDDLKRDVWEILQKGQLKSGSSIQTPHFWGVYIRLITSDTNLSLCVP